jgi:hypothetical protein
VQAVRDLLPLVIVYSERRVLHVHEFVGIVVGVLLRRSSGT